MENNIDIMEHIMSLTRALRRQPHHGRPIPRSFFRVMEILENEDSIQTGELADKLNIRTASLTETLSKMEHAELVIRRRDQEDSRIVRISLTERGTEALNENKTIFETVSRGIREVLTEEEMIQFAAVCEKLTVFFESMPQEDEPGSRTRRGRHHGGRGFGNGKFGKGRFFK